MIGFLQRAALVVSVLGVAGCAVRAEEIGREPALSPVYPNALASSDLGDPTRDRRRLSAGSLWTDTGADLFRDQRAMRVGDVVTVKVSISDQARLANRSQRERTGETDLEGDFSYNAATGGAGSSGSGGLAGAFKGETSHTGTGGIDRSERIDLQLAARVVRVLPDGNLMIRGRQEIRVNYELRTLQIEGILHPRDISAENIVNYERIAEARVAYGGRGRIMEVQQPSWGQQLVDLVLPY